MTHKKFVVSVCMHGAVLFSRRSRLAVAARAFVCYGLVLRKIGGHPSSLPQSLSCVFHFVPMLVFARIVAFEYISYFAGCVQGFENGNQTIQKDKPSHPFSTCEERLMWATERRCEILGAVQSSDHHTMSGRQRPSRLMALLKKTPSRPGATSAKETH